MEAIKERWNDAYSRKRAGESAGPAIKNPRWATRLGNHRFGKVTQVALHH